MPTCTVVLETDERILAEMCHIRARRKGGPRYDPTLTAEEKDGFSNLILLCPTCHTLVDKNPNKYTVGILTRIKEAHEGQASVELTSSLVAQAMRVFNHLSKAGKATASARNRSVAVAIAGDNHAPITINQRVTSESRSKGYPANSIGADANLNNYIDYLCGLWVEYAAGIYPDEGYRWMRIGKSIKQKFRLKRTRHYLSVERFDDLVNFLINDKLAKTPAGRKHLREGTRMCRTLDEYRHGEM